MIRDIRSKDWQNLGDTVYVWCSCGSYHGITLCKFNDENFITIDFIKEIRFGLIDRLKAAWQCIRGKEIESIIVNKDQALELSEALIKIVSTIKGDKKNDTTND